MTMPANPRICLHHRTCLRLCYTHRIKGINLSFANLNLHPAILRAIEESGYTEPTPIQAQAIPEVMAGHDLMASAQTGTGKTAASPCPRSTCWRLRIHPAAAARASWY